MEISWRKVAQFLDFIKQTYLQLILDAGYSNYSGLLVWNYHKEFTVLLRKIYVGRSKASAKGAYKVGGG